MKVMIAVPCMDTVPAVFTECLVGLMKPEGTVLVTARSSLIYDARNILAKMAIDKGFDRILWLDSDMVFKDDLLLRLMRDMDGQHHLNGSANEADDATAVPSSDGYTPSGADTVPAKTTESGLANDADTGAEKIAVQGHDGAKNVPDATSDDGSKNTPDTTSGDGDKSATDAASGDGSKKAVDVHSLIGKTLEEFFIGFQAGAEPEPEPARPRYVSGLYFARKNPIKPVAYKETGYRETEAGTVPYCDPIDGDYADNVLMQVAATGLGGCLMDVKLLQEVYDSFGLPFSPQAGFGEDLSFCRRLEEMGIPMYLDTGVKMGHVAQTVVGEEQYRSGLVL